MSIKIACNFRDRSYPLWTLTSKLNSTFGESRSLQTNTAAIVNELQKCRNVRMNASWNKSDVIYSELYIDIPCLQVKSRYVDQVCWIRYVTDVTVKRGNIGFSKYSGDGILEIKNCLSSITLGWMSKCGNSQLSNCLIRQCEFRC